MKNFLIEKNNNLISVKSLTPLNFAAPIWNFNLWIYYLDNFRLIEDLKQFLIAEENTILEKYESINDGGTGLGNKTVTSRYHKFNLFRYDNLLILELKDIIVRQFESFLSNINSDVFNDSNFDPYMNCWYNVMKPGEQISQHAHSLTNKSFFSGHFTVACEDSYTYYVCPYTEERLEFQNNKGEGIFFPSYINHGTSVHQGIDYRISIAFDIYYNFNQVIESIKDNVVKLYKQR